MNIVFDFVAPTDFFLVQVTGDPAFSMFNLSLREEWLNNKKFCHRLSDDEVIKRRRFFKTKHFPTKTLNTKSDFFIFW